MYICTMNYEQFYTYAFDKLCNYLYVFCKCSDTRQDIVQNAMIYYWQYSKERNKTDFTQKDLNFCKNMVKNRLIDLIRTKHYKETQKSTDLQSCEIGIWDQETAFETTQLVHTLLRTLPSADVFALTQKLQGFANVRAYQIIYKLRNEHAKRNCKGQVTTK